MTETCALRKPCSCPSEIASSQVSCAAVTRLILRASAVLERDRRRRDLLVTAFASVGGAAVVAHDAEHMARIRAVAGEGAKLLRHCRRRCVGDAGHQCGDRRSERPAFFGIVAEAGDHEQPAEIGEAQAERAVFVREPRDLFRGELRHGNGNFQHHGPQPAGMLKRFYVDQILAIRLGGRRGAERQEIERGEITSGVVEEHVFRARVRRPDRAACGAGVPVVDGRVELDARIGAGPGRFCDLVHQHARLQPLERLAAHARLQLPIAILFDRAQEGVVDANGVVGVLARDGLISFALPIGVEARKRNGLEALPRELDDALDVVVRHEGGARGFDLAL